MQGDAPCQNGGNSTDMANLESITTQLLQHGYAVVSEITVYGYCYYPDSEWESDVQNLVNYVEGHVTDAGQKWLGVMLDEESAWGTSGFFYNVNTAVGQIMSSTPGVTWWFNEVFSGCGDWTQATFNQVVGNSTPAPQVSTGCMVNYTNGTGSNYNLVTWSYNYPSPYNSQPSSVNPIAGQPYEACPYVNGTDCVYMSNEFIPS
ncbi:MAG: hypothetical protein ACYCO3_10075 [Mycobacteriales bacterium]